MIIIVSAGNVHIYVVLCRCANNWQFWRKTELPSRGSKVGIGFCGAVRIGLGEMTAGISERKEKTMNRGILYLVIGVLISLTFNPLFKHLGYIGIVLFLSIYFLGGFIVGKMFAKGKWKAKSVLFGIGPICFYLVYSYIFGDAGHMRGRELFAFLVFLIIDFIALPLSFFGASLGCGSLIDSYRDFKE